MKLGARVIVDTGVINAGPPVTGTVIGSATWMQPLNCGTHVKPGTPGYAEMDTGYVVQPDTYPTDEIMVVHADNLRSIE